MRTLPSSLGVGGCRPAQCRRVLSNTIAAPKAAKTSPTATARVQPRCSRPTITHQRNSCPTHSHSARVMASESLIRPIAPSSRAQGRSASTNSGLCAVRPGSSAGWGWPARRAWSDPPPAAASSRCASCLSRPCLHRQSSAQPGAAPRPSGETYGGYSPVNAPHSREQHRVPRQTALRTISSPCIQSDAAGRDRPAR